MDDYNKLAVGLAKKAGKLIKQNFTTGMEKQWKADNTPLTVTDTTINRLVIETIKKKYPDHGIIGEEESAEGASEYVWVCDPIDGTIPFSHGYPLSTFSLALTKNGEPVLGVVFDPFFNRLLVAEKGKGAYFGDKKLHVSKATELKKMVINIEGKGDGHYNPSELKRRLDEKGALVISIAAFVYAGILVAQGEIGGIIFGGQYPWDSAAIKVIVEEAGGEVTDLQGNEQRYDGNVNGVVVSNKKIHNLLLQEVQDSL